MFYGISAGDFNRSFKNTDDCKSYLYNIKWRDGFQCLKCGFGDYNKGKMKFNVRCKCCGYEESVTANTIFHKIKFPLLKAFGMAFRISVRKKGMSTLELSREFSVNKKSAWLFKRKIQEAMKVNPRLDFKTCSSVKVITFGGAGDELNRKFAGEEKLAVIKIQPGKKYSIGAGTIIENEISSNNKSNSTLPKLTFSQTLVIEKSDKPGQKKKSKKVVIPVDVNIVILNLKNWLKGIHHHCSGRFAQGYLDEFFFRFNRRNELPYIWNQLIEFGMAAKPYFYKPLTT